MATGNGAMQEISISATANPVVTVNGEWKFTIPQGFSYEENGVSSNGIDGAIDFSGSTKPLVLRKNARGGKQLSFDLERHFHLLGQYMSVIDCKYDSRITEDNSNTKQIIVIDGSDLYVDIVAENQWPFGVFVNLRVRGDEIAPYDISTKCDTDNQEIGEAVSVLKTIAQSISLCKAAKGSTKTASSKKATKKAINDPNCICQGTTLLKYIGSKRDIVFPDGLTEIADNIFSGNQTITSVVVPEGVKTIGRRTFENCFNLQEAVLPSTLKELGGYSFVDCHELRSVTLGDRLEYISDSLFSECFKLQNVVIPKTVKYIDAFAFKNCRAFTSIVIPNGVESIGFTAFSFCDNLSYLYIPASVKEIRDNFVGDTPFGGCDALTIHCPAGSFAEKYCKSHGIRFVTDNNPITPVISHTARKKSTTSASKTSRMDEYSAEINLSAEASDNLGLSGENAAEFSRLLNEFQNNMKDLAASIDELEKAREEEKKQKENEAIAAGKRNDEYERISMFAVMTDEKALSKIRRQKDEFYNRYEDVFPGLSKKKVIELRKSVLEEIKDKDAKKQLGEELKKRSVKERFEITTALVIENMPTKADFLDRVSESVELTKKWFKKAEYAEFNQLLDAELAERRQILHDKLVAYNPDWTNFATAKKYLRIALGDYAAWDTNQCEEASDMQSCTPLEFAEVRLYRSMDGESSINAFNILKWFWGVTRRAIWEAAYNNDPIDERSRQFDTSAAAKRTIERVRGYSPAMELTAEEKNRFVGIPVEDAKKDLPTKKAEAEVDTLRETVSVNATEERKQTNEVDPAAIERIRQARLEAERENQEIMESLRRQREAERIRQEDERMRQEIERRSREEEQRRQSEEQREGKLSQKALCRDEKKAVNKKKQRKKTILIATILILFIASIVLAKNNEKKIEKKIKEKAEAKIEALEEDALAVATRFGLKNVDIKYTGEKNSLYYFDIVSDNFSTLSSNEMFELDDSMPIGMFTYYCNGNEYEIYGSTKSIYKNGSEVYDDYLHSEVAESSSSSGTVVGNLVVKTGHTWKIVCTNCGYTKTEHKHAGVKKPNSSGQCPKCNGTLTESWEATRYSYNLDTTETIWYD